MKQIFNGEKFGVLTHHDLDGVGCAILLKYVFGSQIKTIKSTGYHKILMQAEKLDCKNIFITDISLNQEQIDKLDIIADNVILIDHHESSLQYDYPEHWKVMINMKASGTKLTYLYLGALGFDWGYDELGYHPSEFVERVNAFDLWKQEDELFTEGLYLNNLFWEFNFFGFFKKLKDFRITEDLLEKGLELQQVKDKEIAEFSNFLIEDLLRVVVAEDHISDISLFYTEEKHFVIIRRDGCYSFRSSLDMQPFFKRLNEIGIPGGGHKHAGGCETKGTEFEKDEMKVIEEFYNWIKESNE